MKIDIHSHILPGVDDGAKTMEETIEMLELAIQEGLEAVVATPHYEAGMDEEKVSLYRQRYEEVATYIGEHQIPIQLYLGNEIYYSESVPELLQQGKVHTLNDTSYVLLEFSVGTSYSTMRRALNTLLYAGYWPIIAHAERYVALRDIKKVQDAVRMGAYIQLNASAITGRDGWHIKKLCKKLLKNHLAHVIGTDSHGSHYRRPKIKECLGYLDKKYGKAYRKQISEENPQKILKGEKISGEN